MRTWRRGMEWLMKSGEMRRRKHAVGRGFAWFGISMWYLLLYVPIVVMIIYSFNTQKQNIIWQGFTTSWYGKLFLDKELMTILSNTLIVSIFSTIISVIIGTMAAYGITRYKFKGKQLLMNIMYVPIVIPEIILGVSLLMVYLAVNIP